MARGSSFMQYMRAHGQTPGPTLRPFTTGAISGLVAIVPYLAVLALSGALSAAADALGTSVWLVAGTESLLMVLAGVLYAAIFQRTANDKQGGWLFGMSYGFMVWMLSPLTIWQLVSTHPFLLGKAAMGSFGAQLAFGLVLGSIFPWINPLVQQSLEDIRTSEESRD